MTIWVKARLLPYLKGVQATQVATGFGGYLGNKGKGMHGSSYMHIWHHPWSSLTPKPVTLLLYIKGHYIMMYNNIVLPNIQKCVCFEKHEVGCSYKGMGVLASLVYPPMTHLVCDFGPYAMHDVYLIMACRCV